MAQGGYFDKTAPDEQPLPAWHDVRALLPAPCYDSNPDAVQAYWDSWELVVKSMKSPHPGSGLVSNYMFFDFNGSEAIFAHDSSVMTMFGRFGHRAFSPIETLDNFYARQHENGEICREIHRVTGQDLWPNDEGDPMTVRLQEPCGHGSRVKAYAWSRPTRDTHPASHCRVDGMTDHKFAWAEMLNYRVTGDASRLARVSPSLCRWYRSMQVYLRDTNGLYITDCAGMDNSPRNLYLGYGIDINPQMVFTAHCLADILQTLGQDKQAAMYTREADELAELIRAKMWNPETHMFHDLAFSGELAAPKTVAGFWPLLARIPTPAQLEGLVAQLEDQATFNRPVRVPSLAADERDYCEWGQYCLGGVWPFTNAAVIAGLECCGRPEVAHAIARSYWEAAVQAWRDTGTVWEYLAPEHLAPGRSLDPDDPGSSARRDFAGWGPYPLIAVFLEQIIGLCADAPSNTLVWNLRDTGCCGCRQFAFGDIVTDIKAAARAAAEETPEITVASNGGYSLILRWGRGHERRFAVGPGGPRTFRLES